MRDALFHAEALNRSRIKDVISHKNVETAGFERSISWHRLVVVN